MPPSTVPSSSSDPFVVQSLDETGLVTGTQAELERARNEYLLRHFEIVKDICVRILQSSRRLIDTNVLSLTARVTFDLLLASTNCLLARTYRITEDSEQAGKTFAESVRLFQLREKDIASQHNAARLYADFGIALYRFGHQGDAQRILEECQKLGTSPSEAFGYLGLIYKDQRKYDKAEAALRKGLQLAPGDPVLCAALGETLELTGKREEAASAYVSATRAALWANNIEWASRLVEKAIKALPTNVPQTSSPSPSPGLFQGLLSSLRALVSPSDSQSQASLQALLPVVFAAVDVYRAKGDFDRALEVINEAERVQQNQPRLVGLRGRVLRDLKRNDEAIAVLQLVPVQSADLAWIWVELAAALLEEGRSEEARPVIENTLKLVPSDPVALRLKGSILLQLGKAAEAEKILTEAFRVDAHSAVTAFELSRAYYALGQFKQALQMMDLALEMAPDWIDVMITRADVLSQMGQKEEALIQARRVLRRDPGNADMLLFIVNTLRELGKIENALREVDAEIERDANSALAWRLRGHLLFDKNDIAEAAKALEAASRLAPTDVDVMIENANALRMLGRYEAALQACEAALKSDSQSEFVLAGVSLCLSEIGEFARSCEVLQSAVKESSKQTLLWYLLGWSLYYRDREPATIDACVASCRNAMEMEPQNPWYRRDLADALKLTKRDNDEKESRRIFEDLLNDSNLTGTSEAWKFHLRGWCYYRLGKYDEAASLLRTIASNAREDVSAGFDYALVLLASGRSEAAASEYRKATQRTSKISPLRRRGVLLVALIDLLDSAREGHRMGHGGETAYRELLKECISSRGDLSQPVWFLESLPIIKPDGVSAI